MAKVETSSPLATAEEAYTYPLMVRHLLAGADQHRDNEIVSAGRRFAYWDFIDRVHRLASLLSSRGVRPGETVAVMDWDSHRYLECYFAIPMMGAVLQTVNVRLSPDQILFCLRQSKASVLLQHPDFDPVVAAIRGDLPAIRHCISMSDEDLPDSYERLIAASDGRFDFVDFDENSIATTFHTTGTTGDPKQVFFSHRQIVLHTIMACAALANQPDGQGMRRSDVYMPITPMFHVNGWGMPFVATMLGMKQVYAGRYDPKVLVELKLGEGVTFSHCVPTILRLVVDAARGGPSLAPWTMLIGGSALPPALAKEAEDAGITAVAGYGMSETGPLISLARAAPGDPVGQRCKAGLPIPLVYARTDERSGNELLLRAPWLTQGYSVQQASDQLWRGGWLHTGDVAAIDDDGSLRIVDRLKDVIKTGGEWISSIELESLLMEHPGVSEAAVVAVPDEKWGERPMAFVVPVSDGSAPTADELRSHLAAYADAGRISRYAVPERFQLVDALPRTSVGKIDKKALKREIGQLR